MQKFIAAIPEMWTATRTQEAQALIRALDDEAWQMFKTRGDAIGCCSPDAARYIPATP
jgi:hypothetical protein